MTGPITTIRRDIEAVRAGDLAAYARALAAVRHHDVEPHVWQSLEDACRHVSTLMHAIDADASVAWGWRALDVRKAAEARAEAARHHHTTTTETRR